MPLLRTVMKLEQTMRYQGVSEEIIAQINPRGATSEEKIVKMVNKMDKLLTPKQCLSIMEQHGCCKTGKVQSTSLAFAHEHAGKTLQEKIDLIPQSDIAYKVPGKLNSDGTLSIITGEPQPGNNRCGCYTIRELPAFDGISKTYCGCCAGLFRHMYQNALGVKLRLIEVVSSIINSNGNKGCEFLFEIIDE